MASVDKDGHGWRVRFMDQYGKRRTIRTGKMSRRNAEQIAMYIDRIVTSRVSGEPVTPSTTAWIADLSQPLRQKLEKAGLVQRHSVKSLGEFLTDHITRGKTTKNTNAAVGTIDKWRAAQTHLETFFGPTNNLSDITEDSAAMFRSWLEDKPHFRTGEPISENTVRAVIACAKMFFGTAVRRGLIPSNPFAGQSAATLQNRDRDFYVSREVAVKIIDACPNVQWRLMVALWRFAGLRKMEIYPLNWDGVLWDSGRFLVTAPKTAHYDGYEERFVPFGDIEEWLDASFEIGAAGPLITEYQQNSNLDKPLKKIMKRAGILPWPKLFQNLRASCETDWLDAGFASHVVAKWMGHSEVIQRKHYAQVDDHHFDQFNKQAKNRRSEKPDQNPDQTLQDMGRHGRTPN